MKKLQMTLCLYGHYIKIQIQAAMQYKVSFLLSVLGQFVVSFNVFLTITFLFKRFSQIEGFTYEEVLLCYGIFQLGFTLAEVVARGFGSFGSIVRYGEFDRMLVRPRSTILQVLGSRFELTRIGRIVQSVIVFTYAISFGNVNWDPLKVVTVITMILGGILLFSGIFLIYAGLTFFTLEGLEFMNLLVYGASEYAKYPIGVYGKKLLWFSTYIIPYSLIQYYPLLYLLGRRQGIESVFLPLLSVFFLLPCYLVWRVGLKHYKSSGS